MQLPLSKALFICCPPFPCTPSCSHLTPLHDFLPFADCGGGRKGGWSVFWKKTSMALSWEREEANYRVWWEKPLCSLKLFELVTVCTLGSCIACISTPPLSHPTRFFGGEGVETWILSKHNYFSRKVSSAAKIDSKTGQGGTPTGGMKSSTLGMKVQVLAFKFCNVTCFLGFGKTCQGNHLESLSLPLLDILSIFGY